MNARTELAIEYHIATEHHPDDATTRSVPTAIVPRTYKLYRDLAPLPLPPPRPSSMPALQALDVGSPGSHRDLDLVSLSSLLRYSAGIVRRTVIRGKAMEFRAASCTGALYHIETYVVTGPLQGLEAGIYHYGVNDNSLRLLRVGDYRRAVHEGTCGNEGSDHAQAILVQTSTFWRNAWRYEERAYRHTFWDAGTIVANLLAVAAAHGVKASVLLGFVDAELNALLDLPIGKEVTVSLVALGSGRGPFPVSPPVSEMALELMPLSPVEIEYPAIVSMHQASSLVNCRDVETWRQTAPSQQLATPSPSKLIPSSPIQEVIERRRSARHFSRRVVSAEQFNVLLACASAAVDCDFVGEAGGLNTACLVVNEVEGMIPGLYAKEAQGGLKLLQAGDLRDQAKHAALDQALAGDAALNLYFVANLDLVLGRFGNRGYRAAQFEAGIRAGRIYLAAYAMGLEATGLTFYDSEVSRLFGTTSAQAAMLLVAVG